MNNYKKDKDGWIDVGFNHYVYPLIYGLKLNIGWDGNGYKITVLGITLKQRVPDFNDAKKVAIMNARRVIFSLYDKINSLL